MQLFVSVNAICVLWKDSYVRKINLRVKTFGRVPPPMLDRYNDRRNALRARVATPHLDVLVEGGVGRICGAPEFFDPRR